MAVFILIDTLAGALGTRMVAMVRGQADSYLPAIDMMMGICALAVISLVLVRFRE